MQKKKGKGKEETGEDEYKGGKGDREGGGGGGGGGNEFLKKL